MCPTVVWDLPFLCNPDHLSELSVKKWKKKKKSEKKTQIVQTQCLVQMGLAIAMSSSYAGE